MSWEITAVTDCRDCFELSLLDGPLNCPLHAYQATVRNVEFTETPLDRPMPGRPT